MQTESRVIASSPTARLVRLDVFDEGTYWSIHFSSDKPAGDDFDAMVLAAVERGVPLPEHGFVVEPEEAFGDRQGDRVLLALI